MGGEHDFGVEPLRGKQRARAFHGCRLYVEGEYASRCADGAREEHGVVAAPGGGVYCESAFGEMFGYRLFYDVERVHTPLLSGESPPSFSAAPRSASR